MGCVISEMRMPWHRRSTALLALVFFVVMFSISFTCLWRQCSLSADLYALRQQREASEEAEQEEAPALVHARMLNDVKTNDYGRYDPAPSMEKPPSKLIPN